MAVVAVQVLDSLIDGPLELGNRREGDELIGMIVRYLRNGTEPSPRTDAQRMALAMVRPVLKKSRARIEAGSKGGSGQQSKTYSKPPSKRQSKTASNEESEEESMHESKQPSDIYSSSSIPDSSSSSEEGVQGEDGAIPYSEIVGMLNEAAGTAYRPTSKKTRQLIHARWAEGYREADFSAVIETMAQAWGNDPKMAAYLRPETLFGTKFESYLNRRRATRREADGYGAYD